MFEKIEATKAENRRIELEAQQHRRLDELEQAKTLLRRRGFAVYANALHDPHCRLIVVGTLKLTPAQVIARAERYKSAQNPKEEP